MQRGTGGGGDLTYGDLSDGGTTHASHSVVALFHRWLVMPSARTNHCQHLSSRKTTALAGSSSSCPLESKTAIHTCGSHLQFTPPAPPWRRLPRAPRTRARPRPRRPPHRRDGRARRAGGLKTKKGGRWPEHKKGGRWPEHKKGGPVA
eukprot:scaffold11577_cov111-Isochrysis_galbana.AAC.1